LPPCLPDVANDRASRDDDRDAAAAEAVLNGTPEARRPVLDFGYDMRSPSTLLAGLALILALVSAVVLIPLWIPVALLAVSVLTREGAIKL
jgi:hypothetical protein